MEKKVEVVALKVINACEVAGCTGEHKFTGMTTTSNPPGFQHQCTKCKELSMLTKQYPYIEFVELSPPPAPETQSGKKKKKGSAELEVAPEAKSA